MKRQVKRKPVSRLEPAAAAMAKLPPDRFPELAGEVATNEKILEGAYFQTEVDDLFKTWLAAFPVAERQTHNCHACRRFIQSYGNLVTIHADGSQRSVFWRCSGLVPPEYRNAVEALRVQVEMAPVKGVFISSEPTWGSNPDYDAKRGVYWDHFLVHNRHRFAATSLKSAGQAMAEKREEFGMLERGLADFSEGVIEKAVALLEGEQLYRGEKTLGVAKWFLDLHQSITRAMGKRAHWNILWRAVASAPPGWAHVRSSMIGTLLEDLAAGMPLDVVRDRFDRKMDPLKYQRAQAAPKAGNIAQAEKVVAALRTTGALDRRFATLEDVKERLWTNPAIARREAPAGGVFSHLRPREEAQRPEVMGGQTLITWEKFQRTVLPTAEDILFQVPWTGNFIALVTAANPEAPPILQWDREGARNPVSWYVVPRGSAATRWNLSAAHGVRVNAICRLPSTWNGDPCPHQGDGVILILDGCRDTLHQSSGGFFTECLKAEYHPVRSTLEAYQKEATVAGKENASACGYDLRKGGKWSATVMVTAGGVRRTYTIDRWD